MSQFELDQTLRQIKRKARHLTRTLREKTYMQYLDQVSREQLSVRHYHEARLRLRDQSTSELQPNSMAFYLSICQEYYLDI